MAQRPGRVVQGAIALLIQLTLGVERGQFAIIDTCVVAVRIDGFLERILAIPRYLRVVAQTAKIVAKSIQDSSLCTVVHIKISNSITVAVHYTISSTQPMLSMG